MSASGGTPVVPMAGPAARWWLTRGREAGGSLASLARMSSPGRWRFPGPLPANAKPGADPCGAVAARRSSIPRKRRKASGLNSGVGGLKMSLFAPFIAASLVSQGASQSGFAGTGRSPTVGVARLRAFVGRLSGRRGINRPVVAAQAGGTHQYKCFPPRSGSAEPRVVVSEAASISLIMNYLCEHKADG
jgi:hypothetical protein